MITGQLPFIHTDPQELARMHKEARPVPPRRFNREIPQELEQIILKVLSKEPAQRYRSADQLGRVLAPFSTHAEIYAIPAVQSANTPPPAARPGAVNSRRGEFVSQPRPYTPPAQQQSHPANQSTQPNPSQPSQPILSNPQGTRFFALLSPTIIFLGLVALLLLVGLLPFWAYILFKFNLIF
jgi:serine/threonine-protein kinase